jgi:hypothetical protein
MFALAITSCDKGEDDPIPGLTMKVAGAAWTATEFSANRYSDRIEIMATGTDTSELLIIIPADTSGIYKLSNREVALAYRPKGGSWSSSQWLDQAMDSLTITVGTTTISGRFTGGNVLTASETPATTTISAGIIESVPMALMTNSSASQSITHLVDGTPVTYTNVTAEVSGTNLAIAGSNATSTFSMILPINSPVMVAISNGNCYYQEGLPTFGNSVGAALVLRSSPTHKTILYYLLTENLSTTGEKTFSEGIFDVNY